MTSLLSKKAQAFIPILVMWIPLSLMVAILTGCMMTILTHAGSAVGMVIMILGFMAIGVQACGDSMILGTMVPMQAGTIPGSMATVVGFGPTMADGMDGAGTILIGVASMSVMTEAILMD